jgi:hypothetical protein
MDVTWAAEGLKKLAASLLFKLDPVAEGAPEACRPTQRSFDYPPRY